jgi:hypothetical protein
MQHKIVLPASFYETQDSPDPAFLKRMQNIDKNLIVYWNKFRGRWIIDRYTCDCLSHSSACPRVNVKLVQTDDGDYHPLNDRVIDWLREADTWNRDMKPDAINSELDSRRDAYEYSRENDLRHLVREAIHDEHMHSDSTFPTIFKR